MGVAVQEGNRQRVRGQESAHAKAWGGKRHHFSTTQ
jgi:hypothetical protein